MLVAVHTVCKKQKLLVSDDATQNSEKKTSNESCCSECTWPKQLKPFEVIKKDITEYYKKTKNIKKRITKCLDNVKKKEDFAWQSVSMQFMQGDRFMIVKREYLDRDHVVMANVWTSIETLEQGVKYVQS